MLQVNIVIYRNDGVIYNNSITQLNLPTIYVVHIPEVHYKSLQLINVPNTNHDSSRTRIQTKNKTKMNSNKNSNKNLNIVNNKRLANDSISYIRASIQVSDHNRDEANEIITSTVGNHYN